MDTGPVLIESCPYQADYTQERFIVDSLRHWQNHTPLYEPHECPNWLHEGISLAASIEVADMRKARNG